MAGTELFTIYGVCQEPYGLVAMPGLPHGENMGSNPPSPTYCKQNIYIYIFIVCIIGIMYVYFL